MTETLTDKDKSKKATIFSAFDFPPIETPKTLLECKCVEGLSMFLGFETYDKLRIFIYPHTKNLYRSFNIEKRNGSYRAIKAPRKTLKKVQKTIALELESIYKPRKSAHGFIKEKSIVTNAANHVNKKFVFNLDLSDFFETIHFGRVRNLFQSYPMSLNHSVATVLAHLCCNDDSLPQGAPTSPIISNMITYKLDKDLHFLSVKNRCTYTRYVDDLTFSFTQSRGKLPKDILSLSKDKELTVGKELKNIIQENGFSINAKKTRVYTREQRQEVTGLNVNDRVNVSRKFIKKVSSMLYAWNKFGLKNAEKEYFAKYNKKTISKEFLQIINEANGNYFIKIIKGRINYIKMIRGSEDKIYRKLAYRLSVCLGSPEEDLLKTAHDFIADSTFIIKNYMDDSQGTAFLLEKIGLITNQHCVDGVDEDLSDTLDIFRHNEIDHKRTAKFIKATKKRDLAILKPSTDFNGLKRLKIGDDSKLKIGQKITVVGFPQYSEGESAYINTGKIVQSKILFEQKIWLVDIPIIHGNSGGPVVNENNEVIGIASVGSAKHDQSTKFTGFIPISTLLSYHEESA